jgi:hypothetical protein
MIVTVSPAPDLPGWQTLASPASACPSAGWPPGLEEGAIT